ncbi:energy transducer TonB [Flavobacterium hercynium]|uniref:TonB C-terminal domain-containing protein n=1 Tax=Flavobacterium hercynium TaxID=387094 RepID=A0A226GSE4_9FLAO|nr:energy transducer TonB [Flavobacterium hercynium]OXA84371.1 hypothetical protein B0A66_21035 [Flavobacterium hercynium]SMP03525.1 TonB protein C-terminal [Flavobacterium hercynium]
MNNHYKITIAEPCQEDWNKMTPNKEGRFCMNCSKTVTDFSAMSADEIQRFFIENQNKKICGRFKKSQLDAIIIQIPSRILYTQTSYHKMFLLALFITMGTTLFSCADNEGNKVTIEKIEVVEDIKKAIPLQTEIDSLDDRPNPMIFEDIKAMPDVVNFVEGPRPYYDTYITGTPALDTYPICYIEKLPEYPGGNEKFYSLLKNEFKIPKKAKKLTGEIEVSFVIDKDGIPNQIKVFDNIGHETGEEIIRTLQLSKKWKPGVNEKGNITVMRLKIMIEKDSLNPERRNRKLSKISSIAFINERNESISQIN